MKRSGSDIAVLAIVAPGDGRERFRRTAEGEPWAVEYCGSIAAATRLLENGGHFAAVVLDRDVTGAQWEGAVRTLAGAAPATRIVLAAEGVSQGLWQRVVEHGGHDVLTKPFRPDEVRRAILHAHWYKSTLHLMTPLRTA